jgi:hypothetical protein
LLPTLDESTAFLNYSRAVVNLPQFLAAAAAAAAAAMVNTPQQKENEEHRQEQIRLHMLRHSLVTSRNFSVRSHLLRKKTTKKERMEKQRDQRERATSGIRKDMLMHKAMLDEDDGVRKPRAPSHPDYVPPPVVTPGHVYVIANMRTQDFPAWVEKNLPKISVAHAYQILVSDDRRDTVFTIDARDNAAVANLAKGIVDLCLFSVRVCTDPLYRERKITIPKKYALWYLSLLDDLLAPKVSAAELGIVFDE